MSTTQIRKELHEYIEGADDRLIKLIYGLVLADKVNEEVPVWHQKIVSERLEKYEQNPDKVVSWEALKSRIEGMR